MLSYVLPRIAPRPRSRPYEVQRSTVVRASIAIAAASGAGTLMVVLCYAALSDGCTLIAVGYGTAALTLLGLGAVAGSVLASRVASPIVALATSAEKAAGELKFAEARHESFWTHTPEGLFTVEVTADGRFRFAGINPAHERLTGLSAADIVGKEPHECLTPAAAEWVTGRYRECVRRGEAITYDEMLDLPGGLKFWRTSLAPVRDPASGRIALLFGNARDVTPDLEANAALARLNARLRSILSSVSDCYYTLDRNYRITAANPAALQWIGLDEMAAVGRSVAQIFPPGDEFDRATRKAIDNGEVVHVELPSTVRPGRWVDYHVYPSAEGASVFFRDITEAKAAREALDGMSRQLLASQEAERQRIAAELHDSTVQHIVSAELNLMRLPEAESESARSIRAEIEGSLDEALKEIRVFTYLLHPAGLHSDGLNATLKTFVEGFARRAGLQASLHASPVLDGLSKDLQHSIFRVVQEALLNVHRHASATRVAVGARLVPGLLFVRIRDDGRGMPREAGDPSGSDERAQLGVGIPGMRARLRQFGGDLTIRSRAGGTTLLAVVPVVPSRAAVATA